ncbi:hypothetical protein PUN28_008156 [Cardiocondyla obscurior]|uniref:Uncharacterized protein n=1 Tax=Cardiocondyla obscurior TaxID=286306 RepID=A0AAW2FYJ8_9HYME
MTRIVRCVSIMPPIIRRVLTTRDEKADKTIEISRASSRHSLRKEQVARTSGVGPNRARDYRRRPDDVETTSNRSAPVPQHASARTHERAHGYGGHVGVRAARRPISLPPGALIPYRRAAYRRERDVRSSFSGHLSHVRPTVSLMTYPRNGRTLRPRGNTAGSRAVGSVASRRRS